MQTAYFSRKAVRVLALGVAFFASCALSSATTIATTTYFFKGTCADCGAGQTIATGELTLQSSYQLGTSITAFFVSFHYDGSSMLPAFTINSSDTGLIAAGSLPTTLPGAALTTINIGNNNTLQFQDKPTGVWCAGNSCGADQGTAGVFATPEPGSLAFLGLGAAVALAGLRRRLIGR
jgi:hypothetical protein